ncbi:MAG TPA: pseudouridine synthase [Flavitalea sp.]|nr:pseudouridine synthase [Flavitalea sp.]
MAKAFQRFIKKAEKGSVLKEKIRQEKKKQRQETKEFFDKKKEEARQFRLAQKELKDPTKAGDYNYSRKPKETRPADAPKRGRPASNPRPPKKELVLGPRKPAERKPVTISKGNASKTVKPLQLKTGKAATPQTPEQVPEGKLRNIPEQMPLNKYVAHAGICSRRDGANLVKSGKVSVNDKLITEPGFKVGPNDVVKFQGKTISARKNLVYILLNKPKDFITTMEDPEGRKTVYDIIQHATSERVYPIGRLDRNTTGVLLFTNDGDLAQKLSHPSYEVKKIYEVRLDKPLTKKDFDTLLGGITLEDGFVQPDSLAYADSMDKSIIGIEIHSGRNRIVRRLFESLGYDVKNLDRVMFANLTKKNVERGKFRHLSEKEVRLLKFMNASYGKKKSGEKN